MISVSWQVINVLYQEPQAQGQEKGYYLALGTFNQAIGLWYTKEVLPAKADVEQKVATMIEVYKTA